MEKDQDSELEEKFHKNIIMELAKEGKLTIYEALSLQKQDEIIEKLRDIKMRLNGLETIAKYSRF